MSNTRMLTVVLATMIGFGSAGAQAQTLSSLAEITNFNYTLTDLKPNDWVSPSLTAGKNGSLVNFENQVDLSGADRSSPEDRFSSNWHNSLSLIDATQVQEGFTLNGGFTKVSKDGGSLSAQTSGDASTFADVPFGFEPGGVSGEAALRADARGSSWWSLSANTAAVLTGTLRLQLSADASVFASDPYLQSTGVSVGTAAWGQVHVSASQQGVGDVFNAIEGEGGIFYLAERIDFSDALSPPGYTVTNIGGVSYLERHFEIRVTNTTNKALDLYFQNMVGSGTWVRAIDATSAIPEPGTWAFMGIGLGLMAWRVRASRRPIAA